MEDIKGLMIKRFLTYIGAFFGTLLILWLLLFLSALIPNESIKENMIDSAYYYSDKQPYQFPKDGKFNGIEDNYADSILLGVLWNMDSDNAFETSLDTKYYDGDERGENFGLYAAINGHEANVDYSRYWHGSVTFIRPLMLITTVDNIEWISFGVFAVLLLIVCIILIKKKCAAVAGILLISLACVQIWNIRLSLEYMPAFIVAMVMSILFLLMEKRGDSYITILSVISGVMVAFYDFLTTETVAILLPFALVFMVRAKEERLGERKDNIVMLIKSGLAWASAYVSTFVVKWVVASAVTGENKIIASFSSAKERFNGVETEENISAFQEFLYAIPANLSTVFGGTVRVDVGNVIGGLIIFVMVAGSIFYLFSSKEKNKEIAFILLIIGLLPYVRFAVLNNHSYLHEFFTYRAQCVSVFALFGMIYFNTRFSFVLEQGSKASVRKKYTKKNAKDVNNGAKNNAKKGNKRKR